MKKKALRKDVIRTIQKTFPRFLSIFFIVALGVAFFSGVRVTEPDMRYSADSQFDHSNLMDVRILGTMGITNADVDVIRGIKGVSQVEASYSIDVISKLGNEEEVIKVMADTKDLNQINVSKGRMPKTDEECLVDETLFQKKHLKIGDQITLTSGTSDDIKDSLNETKVTVVGVGSSTYYLARDRGTATIGNGKVSGFLVVPKTNFKSDVYTALYLTVDGAKEEIAYTDAYDDTLEKVTKKLEDLGKTRSVVRQNEIKQEATDEIQKQEKKLNKEKKKTNQKLAEGKKKLDDGKKQLETAKATLASNKKTIAQGQAALKDGWSQYNQGKKQLKAAKKQLKTAKKELNENESQLNAAKEQLNQQVTALGGWENLPEQAKEELTKTKATLDAKEKQLKAAKKTISSNEKKLNQQEKKLKTSKKTLEQKEKELKDGKAKLESGEKTIKESESTLKKSEAEYNKSKKKAQKEFKKAEAKIEDAKKEVDEIELPKWYVLDRNTNQSYVEYGEETKRIGAIGKVFPAIFFLVAALVSLTTMTRMVEEQRTQIGTLKALGYSKGDIAFKFVIYALLATVFGSILGVLVGENLLPRIIIVAYTMMYTGIQTVVTPLDATYGFMAAGAAIVITSGATIFACLNELREKPANLMRPEAPKEGKRILIERIALLWNHLSFTWKSTLRNLFRYKKRFFMTAFGISGCMALLLVGFGLKDSIFSITSNQYGQNGVMNYEATVSFEDKVKEKEKKNIQTTLENESMVDEMLQVYSGSVDVKGKKVTKNTNFIVTSDKDKIEDYITFRSRTSDKVYHLDDEGIIISEKLAKLLDVQVGDVMTIQDGETKSVKVKVSEITENYLQHYVYMSETLYESLYKTTVPYNSYLCKNKKNDTKSEEELRSKLLKQDGIAGVSYVSEVKNEMDDMLSNLNIVVLVLTVSAGLLAFVVLYNLNNINIAERRGELATLKVLGFYDGEVGAYVYRENILLTLIGTALGVLLGILLHRYVILTAEIDMIMFGRSIFLKSYLYSILLTFGFAAFINFMMFFQLRRIDMVESLKSPE